MKSKKSSKSANKPTAKAEAKYNVNVCKYRKEYGTADFYVGSANTLDEARKIVKRNTRDGDGYIISNRGKDFYRAENQIEKGFVSGSGETKKCKKTNNKETGWSFLRYK